MFDIFTVSDAEHIIVSAIAELEQKVFQDPWSRKDIEGFILSAFHGLLVCTENGVLCGYAVFSSVAGEGELLRIATAPDTRRRGVAGAILDKLTESLKNDNGDKLFLEVRESNAPAIALYGSRGFSEISHRNNYYHDPVEDAIVMSLDLAV